VKSRTIAFGRHGPNPCSLASSSVIGGIKRQKQEQQTFVQIRSRVWISSCKSSLRSCQARYTEIPSLKQIRSRLFLCHVSRDAKYQAHREEMGAATRDRKSRVLSVVADLMIHGAKISSAQSFMPQNWKNKIKNVGA